ncbi:VPLPA-CTERM sorting domain-containing protein [Hyphococcus lacteus]|uniref:VPLPA-CTERM sorting domain-containing protein n=1 Tax=Hyphococcus lacteus TaxID=3143536 RepID=A0ABV3Z9Y5_9PROT
MKTGIYAICLFLVSCFASSQAAVLTVTGRDVGNDVVFTVSGNFDTTGLSPTAGPGVRLTGVTGAVDPNQIGHFDTTIEYGALYFAVTESSPGFSSVDTYYDTTATLPSLGPLSVFSFADIFSGDAFGIGRTEGTDNGNPYSEPGISVPVGYVSLDAIFAEMIFLSTTLAAMGFEEGYYSFIFGNNVINIDLTNTTVPLPAAAPLFLIGLMGVGAMRRKKKVAF